MTLAWHLPKPKTTDSHKDCAQHGRTSVSTLGMQYCLYLGSMKRSHGGICSTGVPPCCTAPSASMVQSAWTLASLGSSRGDVFLENTFSKTKSPGRIPQESVVATFVATTLGRGALAPRCRGDICRSSSIVVGLNRPWIPLTKF